MTILRPVLASFSPYRSSVTKLNSDSHFEMLNKSKSLFNFNLCFVKIEDTCGEKMARNGRTMVIYEGH